MKNVIVLLCLICRLVVCNEMSDGIAAGKVQDPNSVKYDAADSQQGRAYKANDASNVANRGANGAALTGSLLLAAAIPLLSSIFLVQRLAGADLMAKAGLEFAQAAADKSVANTNANQRAVLTADIGESPEIQSGIDAKKDKSLEDLSSYLKDKGIDADPFIRDLTSGNLTNATDVLKGLGQSENFSNDELAEAEKLSTDNLTSISADVNDKLKTPLITADESNSSNGELKAEGTASVVGGSVASRSVDNDGTTAAGILISQKEQSAIAATNVNPHLNVIQKTMELGNSLLASFGFNPDVSKNLIKTDVYDSWDNGSLEKIGVSKPQGRFTIFQKASRSYREYGKWRKPIKVSQN